MRVAAGAVSQAGNVEEIAVADERDDNKISRRDLLKNSLWFAGLVGIGGSLGLVAGNAEAGTVWQIDPNKCINCDKCASECVLGPSAVESRAWLCNVWLLQTVHRLL